MTQWPLSVFVHVYTCSMRHPTHDTLSVSFALVM